MNDNVRTTGTHARSITAEKGGEGGVDVVPERAEAPHMATSVTDGWLAAAPYLPPLRDPAAATADRLILLLHYGIDWSDRNWVASRRGDYWDTLLPSRIQEATYRSGTDLHRWWSAAASHLGSTPRNDAERIEVATLLATAEPKPVLAAMRDQTTALTLRTRIVADAVRAERHRPPASVDSDGIGA